MHHLEGETMERKRITVLLLVAAIAGASAAAGDSADSKPLWGDFHGPGRANSTVCNRR